MQDETLLDKSAVKQQQLSPNPESNHSDQSLEESLIRKAKSEGSSPVPEEKKNDSNSINSVTSSLQQLGLSEPSTTIMTSLASAPSFWSTATADDTFIQGFQALNGQVTFQNFPPAPNALFNSNLAPQLNLNVPQQQAPQRRAITAQHNFQQQRQHAQQSNLFLNNTKTYPTWSSAPQQSSWSAQQNQTNLSPWGNIQQQRRSVPNLNPISAPVKKNNPHHHQSVMISPSKFRRSTSYPGQMQQAAIGTKPTFELSGLDDHREGNSMLNFQQVLYSHFHASPTFNMATPVMFMHGPYFTWFLFISAKQA